MERTLLLNATYEPLRVISWKKAVTLLYQEKVEVIEAYDRNIHSVSNVFRLPSVLRLLTRIKPYRPAVKFSRQNVFLRDQYRCQYCGKEAPEKDLTFDHVIPLTCGGKTTWTNIVTACIPCNRKKSGDTPKAANMRLLKEPQKPNGSSVLTLDFQEAPAQWNDYLCMATVGAFPHAQ